MQARAYALFLLLLHALQNFSCNLCSAKKHIKALLHDRVKSQGPEKLKKSFLMKLLVSAIYFPLGTRNPCDTLLPSWHTGMRVSGLSGYRKWGSISLRLSDHFPFHAMKGRKWKLISLGRPVVWCKGAIRRGGGSSAMENGEAGSPPLCSLSDRCALSSRSWRFW